MNIFWFDYIAIQYYTYWLLTILEPSVNYLDALAPFQPLQMKAISKPIDTSLNFSQVKFSCPVLRIRIQSELHVFALDLHYLNWTDPQKMLTKIPDS